MQTNKLSKFLLITLTTIFVGGFLFALNPQTVNAYYLETNQSADVVVGQSNFTSSLTNQGLGSPSANTLSNPRGVFTDGTRLFVADKLNNRVLIYNSIPTSNNTSADVVIGQTDFVSNSAGTAVNKLSGPGNVFILGTKIFIADSNNHRVLIYNSIPSANGASADVVIGQADFNSGGVNQGREAGLPLANTLYFPAGVWSDGAKLYIADSANYRLLIYNTIPVTNNASANVVVGQADFTSSAYIVGPNKTGVVNFAYSNGEKLFITDSFNRLLIFNSIPITNYVSADLVIGQLDLNSGVVYSSGANTVANLRGIFSDGSKLFLADNNRILLFNSIPTSNNASADVVIGQADFTHNSANQGVTVTANSLNIATSISVDNSRLIVADYSNHRVLIYYLKITAPTITIPQALTSTSIRWNFVSNDTIQTGFKLYDSSNNLLATSTNVNATYIDETGLTPNTQYSGRYIKAYNANGESQASQTASIYTLPETPTGLTAVANSNNAITLTTDRFTNDTQGQSGYYFESSSGNNSGWIQTNTWQDTVLACGTTYSYTVKYRNADSTQTSTISTTQATSTCAAGNAMMLLVLQAQAKAKEQSQQTQQPQVQTQPQTQEQKQILITQLKTKLAELMQQLILMLQEQIRNR